MGWALNKGANIDEAFGTGECPQWYYCSEGGELEQCYSFYSGCTSCQTDNFNTMTDSVLNARAFCGSWGSNQGFNNLDKVFGVGRCPQWYHCSEGREGHCYSFFHGCTSCQTESL